VSSEPSGSKAEFHTGIVWGILGLLLLFGTVASGFVVYGFLGLVGTHEYLVNGIILVVSGAFAVVVILLMAGILYRIDRLRGTPHRRVELFE
jgi:hypothetical protein